MLLEVIIVELKLNYVQPFLYNHVNLLIYCT